MTNLLHETQNAIRDAGKTADDVAWTGSRDGVDACSWEHFTRISDIWYDSGYGAAEVASDLVIVFTDQSWLERFEYDGHEGWEIGTLPTLNDSPRTPQHVASPGGLWPTMANLNTETA